MIRYPLPQVDESLRGYVCRITERSNYPLTFWGFEMFRLNHGRVTPKLFMLVNEENLNILSHATGVSENDLLSLSFFKERQKTSLTMEEITYLDSKGFSATRTRICTGCFNEKKYYRKYWDINLFTCCPIHKCLLISNCSNCGRPVNPNSLPMGKCKCGEQLMLGVSNQSASSDVEEMIMRKHSGLEIQKNFQTPLDKLDFLEFIYLLMVLSNCIASAFMKKHISFHNSGMVELNSINRLLAMILMDWPKGFHKLLDDIRNTSEKDQRGLKPLYGLLYTRLYNTLNSEHFDFIRIAFEEYLYMHWEDGLLGSGSIKKISSNLKAYFVSGFEAARLLNLEHKKIKKMIRDGELEGILVQREKTTLVLIKSTSIEKYNSTRWINKEKVRKMLGLSHRFTDELIESGTIPAKFISNSVGKQIGEYSKKDVQSILNSFSERSQKASPGEVNNLMDFEQTLQFLRYRRIKLSRLVEQVIHGHINPYYRDNKESTLKQFMFSQQDIDRACVVECDHKVLVSARQAAILLGADVDCVRNWAEAGCFEEVEYKNKRWRICVNSVEQFTEKFISLSQIIKATGKTQIKILSELSSMDIQPVHGRSGSKGYLFNKSEVLNYLGLVLNGSWLR